MANKLFNEIKSNIDKSELTTKNKRILHNINKLLSNYKTNMQANLQIPILILTKAIDNTDILCIERLITDMLKKYDIFGGKLQDTVNLSNTYYKELITKIEKDKAYKIEIDDKFLDWGGIEIYFSAIERIVDTKAVFILLKCMPNAIEKLEEHTIIQKADYIISNNSTVGELANRLLDRYKYNEINNNIDIKELKSLITHNLGTEAYKTDEMCLQYMFLKSIKSYIASNRKSLEITDIPKISDTGNVRKKSNSQDDELSKLVGLEYIKDEIDRIIKYATFNKQARKDNPNIPKENLNMCFLGNPRNTVKQQ